MTADVDRSAIVVGGGIMGTATAWALRRLGWAVTLLEQGPLPNPHSSSGGVHRLIRSTYGTYAGYAASIPPAYDAWELLWTDLGQTFMTHTGMLAVDTPTSTFGADSAAVLADLGLPYTLLDEDEVRRRYPQFHVPTGATALYTDQAHFLRAGQIVDALATWLAGPGHATVRTNARVTDVNLTTGTVTLTDGSRLTADHVVVAAGPWTERLLGTVGTGLTPSRQLVLDLAPPAHLRASWEDGPAFLLPPMYGIPPREGLPLKISDHHFSMTGDPDDDRTPIEAHVREMLDVGASALVDLDRYEVLEARTCFYTVHDEERFVVAPYGERGVVASGFSGHGFKFGALIGHAIAAGLDGEAHWPDVTDWAAGHRTKIPFSLR